MIRIVDTHQHFWKLGQIHYPWLMDDPPLASNREIIQDYLPSNYFQDVGGLPILKSVHVEALPRSIDRIAETSWLQGLADLSHNGGFPHGIVASVDLSADDFEKTLDEHSKFPNLRGTRQILNPWAEPENLLSKKNWRANFARLADWGLSFDMHIEASQMEDGARLARRYPDVRIALNHAGLPDLKGDSGISAWRQGMRHLSACENIFIKLSGFGMLDHDCSIENIRHIVLDTIDMFGVERCMFGSNFPVCKPYISFQKLWTIYLEIASEFDPDERDKIFYTNAVRFYRL
jgi:predicted TIM-barrel fold metal-dependent hydrolase